MKDLQPQHKVYLDAFFIDVYEVTNAAYVACVKAGACQPPWDDDSETRRPYYGVAQYDDYPVLNVNWDQAKTYCEWRGARLPTEAEWEKAARGGLEDKAYPWGDEAPDCTRANFGVGQGCVGDTSRVGSYPANGYGLYDMAGNVFEWVLDWYSGTYYIDSPDRNPSGPISGSDKVARGGSWNQAGIADPPLDVVLLRTYARFSFSPDTWHYIQGFRCARSVQEATPTPPGAQATGQTPTPVPSSPARAPTSTLGPSLTKFSEDFSTFLNTNWVVWGYPGPKIESGNAGSHLALSAMYSSEAGVVTRNELPIASGDLIEFGAQLDPNFPQYALVFDWDPVPFERGAGDTTDGAIHVEIRKDSLILRSQLNPSGTCEGSLSGTTAHVYQIKIVDQSVAIYVDAASEPLCQYFDIRLVPASGHISFRGMGWVIFVSMIGP